MAKIIYQDQEILLDAEVAETLYEMKCGLYINDQGYPKLTKHGNMRLSRFVMQALPGQVIDHINRDKLDNRRINLRFVTVAENAWNVIEADPRSSTGFRGVTLHEETGKWRARICRHGNNRSLGLFDTPEEAHAAYCAAKLILHKIGD